MIIVEHKDITSHCALQELAKWSSSGFQRLLRHISVISYLLMNYSWAPAPFALTKFIACHQELSYITL